MIVYMFSALLVDGEGKRSFGAYDLKLPGRSNLFEDLRNIGQEAGLGRYRRLDLNIDSPTLGYHLFEKGIVKLSHIHL